MKKIYKIDIDKLTYSDVAELEQIIINKSTQLNPEYETVIISLPKNDSDMRQKILAQITQIYTSADFEEYCVRDRKKREEVAANRSRLRFLSDVKNT